MVSVLSVVDTVGSGHFVWRCVSSGCSGVGIGVGVPLAVCWFVGLSLPVFQTAVWSVVVPPSVGCGVYGNGQADGTF